MSVLDVTRQFMVPKIDCNRIMFEKENVSKIDSFFEHIHGTCCLHHFTFDIRFSLKGNECYEIDLFHANSLYISEKLLRIFC